LSGELDDLERSVELVDKKNGPRKGRRTQASIWKALQQSKIAVAQKEEDNDDVGGVVQRPNVGQQRAESKEDNQVEDAEKPSTDDQALPIPCAELDMATRLKVSTLMNRVTSALEPVQVPGHYTRSAILFD
jgi:hypothetical protein